MERDKLVTLQWSQCSDIMGGYNTPDAMLRDRTSAVYHEIKYIRTCCHEKIIYFLVTDAVISSSIVCGYFCAICIICLCLLAFMQV